MNVADVYKEVSGDMFDFAKYVETPSVIYDFDHLEKVVSTLKSFLAPMPSLWLNYAVKACCNFEVLCFLAEMDIGCDVASVYEMELAIKAGFKKVTTTAPAYSATDMEQFNKNNITIDLNSLDQIKLYEKTIGNKDAIGLRLKVQCPSSLDGNSDFESYSRFGVNILDKELIEYLSNRELRVSRLHLHTGETSLRDFKYKLQYLLLVAEQFTSITEVILGGGIFLFISECVNRGNFLFEMQVIVDDWKSRLNRDISIYIEPGGALVSSCGFLVSTVMSREVLRNDIQRITVDSSSWNLMPWANPNVAILKQSGSKMYKTAIAGCTLYEDDYVGLFDDSGMPRLYELCDLSANDRLLFSIMGGYTVTNMRRFNGMPAPKEYKVKGGVISEITRTFE